MQAEKRLSGVNLVDVIAVTLIVFGMAAVLQPVIVKAHGETATCQSHMKQLGLGLIQYLQDYDEQWPGGAEHWAGDIYPYIKSTNIYVCPNDTVKLDVGDEVSYALNTNLQGAGGLPKLTEPARTVCEVEYDGTPPLLNWGLDHQSKSTTGNGKNTAWGNGKLGRIPPTDSLRHDPYINVVACDGHVQELLPSQISSGRDSVSPTAKQTVGGASGTGALGDTFTITFSQK